MALLLLRAQTTYSLPLIRIRSSPKFTRMALNITTSSSSSSSSNSNGRKLPILLFDVMDTIVRDPFYQDIPAFFRMSFKELIDSKHPTAWIEFEEGCINEMELARKFFSDGRPIDLEGLKDCVQRGYSYLEGVEELLHTLKQNGYEMHAFTNYPIWYKMIEDKLKVSKYLSWTFCSCITGKRKPDPAFYLQVLTHLDADPKNCIFIDDRNIFRFDDYPLTDDYPFRFDLTVDAEGYRKEEDWNSRVLNVDAATKAGIVGLQFKNANLLRQDLSLLGIDISTNENYQKQDLMELGLEHLP